MLNHIKQTAASILPKGSVLYLYGSRARGDYHEDSDWDLLLLLDKPKLEHDDFEKYSYPFVLMGWDLGADLSRCVLTTSLLSASSKSNVNAR